MHGSITFCLPVNGPLGCFHLLAIVSNTAVSLGVQVYVQMPAFCYSGYISRSEIARSYGSSLFNDCFP